MTDYSSRVRIRKGKQGVVSASTLAILLVGVVLSFVAVGGILSAKKGEDVVVSRWDGVSSFVVAVNSGQDYIAILQKDPKRAVLFALGDVASADVNPANFMKTLSSESGVVVDKYLTSGGNGDVAKNFEQFKSYITPLKIVIGGWDRTNNNISRYDALRLWWLTKNIRVEEVDKIEFERNATVVSSQTTLGANTGDFNRVITPYVENLAILNEDLEINIQNSSGDVRAGALANTFVSSVGGRVAVSGSSTNLIDKCLVEGPKSYTREYLAKTFDCVIKDEVLGESGKIITLVVGADFAKTYF